MRNVLKALCSGHQGNPGEMKSLKRLHKKTRLSLTNDSSQPPYASLPSALTGIFKIPLRLKNRLFEKPAMTFRVIYGAKRHANRYVAKLPKFNPPPTSVCPRRA